jgi:Ca2+-binding EF-hand superfamily protein
MFKVFYLDANDRIDQDEFILMMNAFYVAGKNKRVELKHSQELFVEIDANEDGQIDLSEFVTWGETVSFIVVPRGSGLAC